ncbi:hypothetical protein CLOHYLEM_06169 [[Clostridium] hylemonae DSM 15053]|uniref:Uncharacterized protein n=1 Tax=[Clostridium] hylemonae DSM 15053 TaxID=553973 RepID=C0C1Z8_9FIRM|nr:hypothetical protein CLOHYLEM_06169 [[Clostridium] hylemonae DSM 15053]
MLVNNRYHSPRSVIYGTYIAPCDSIYPASSVIPPNERTKNTITLTAAITAVQGASIFIFFIIQYFPYIVIFFLFYVSPSISYLL